MEEHKRGASMDFKCPRKLDFNAPLLSTRKHPGGYIGGEEAACCSYNLQGKLQDTSDRIPFCWEQAPGKPKKRSTDNIYVNSDADTPRLKIPPSRWHPPKKEVITDDHSLDHDIDEGCDADVDNDDDYDDDEENNYDDIFSDAVEVMSLTEAMDIVEKEAEKNHHHHGLDGFNPDTLGTNNSISPSYIIERFLPDATALAASSVLSVSKNLSRKLPYVYNHPDACNVPGGLQRSYSLTKGGCGLEMLLPWRIKHKICGIKSPVRHGSANVHLQPQCGGDKNKGSSIVRHFGDIKKHT
ncbi:hypothetical protein ACOSQ2_029514 [Xanthoceras sorbifolium]